MGGTLKAETHEWTEDWREFVESATRRLEAGAKEYGNRSFTEGTDDDVVKEIADECLDLAAWGFVLWRRVEKLRQHTEE
jgi:hypothetical protein